LPAQDVVTAPVTSLATNTALFTTTTNGCPTVGQVKTNGNYRLKVFASFTCTEETGASLLQALNGVTNQFGTLAAPVSSTPFTGQLVGDIDPGAIYWWVGVGGDATCAAWWERIQ
jgi:hypothetical protein